MREDLAVLWIGLVVCATTAAAQTTVTNNNDGVAGAVPVYSGSRTLSPGDSSAIYQSGGNVGIGTTAPNFSLHVIGDIVSGGQNAGQSGAVGFLPPGSVGSWFWIDNPGASGNYLRISNGNTPGGAGNVVINNAGAVGIGTTSPGAKLEVDGNLKLTAGSGSSITFQDGTTQSTAYTGVTCGGDYAESVDVHGSRKSYQPGDVLVLTSGGDGDVAKSSEPYSTLIAGIYSTKPGTIGRRQLTDMKAATSEVPMAMVGIVPTKVSAENGAIRRGDLLVTASLGGYAMKGTDRSRMLGAVIGKAMGSLESGTGVIEVLVTLQ